VQFFILGTSKRGGYEHDICRKIKKHPQAGGNVPGTISGETGGIQTGGARKFVLSGYEGEKIRVRLASDTLSTLQNDFKVKLDDIRNRIDVDVERKNGVTEAKAKEEVCIFVQIPSPYIGKIECAVNAGLVQIHALECETIELDAKTPRMVLEDVVGTVEINCNLDMEIFCRTLNGVVEINQISATSRICVPEGVVFTAVRKGIATSIFYEKNGELSEDLSTAEADNVIELNGIKSELVIYTSTDDSLCGDGK
jgi:hypothetical protein